MTEFYGFERPDGSVGVRNHLLVLAPIDCSFEPARRIASQVEGLSQSLSTMDADLTGWSSTTS